MRASELRDNLTKRGVDVGTDVQKQELMDRLFNLMMDDCKECKDNQNVKFYFHMNEPYPYWIAMRNIEKDETLWGDYGDDYWKNWNNIYVCDITGYPIKYGEGFYYYAGPDREYHISKWAYDKFDSISDMGLRRNFPKDKNARKKDKWKYKIINKEKSESVYSWLSKLLNEPTDEDHLGGDEDDTPIPSPSGEDEGGIYTYTNTYSNGNIKEEGNYVDGKKEDVWFSYYDNGEIMEIKTYRDGKKNG